jgi:predicted dienelactone hydrolase
VVAAPPHPGHTADDFPDCLLPTAVVDTVLNRLPDVRFTIDAMLAEAAADGSSRFARHIRPDAIGMSGVSFGAFTTLLAAQQEPRLRAALALVPGGSAALGPVDIAIPTMVIGAERDRVVEFAESEKVYARVAGPRFLVELLGANHLSAVDSCFNADLGVDLCVAEDISQGDAHRLVLRYALPFAERYLAGRRAAGRALGREVRGVVLEEDP